MKTPPPIFTKVVIHNFNINGIVRSVTGNFIKEMTNPHSKGKWMVRINGVEILLDPDKVELYDKE